MNNTQINNTSYYVLPCGKQVEDYIWERNLPFWFGSALKYRYRAGNKDGEDVQKDLRKMMHYASYAAMHRKVATRPRFVSMIVEREFIRMCGWDGKRKLARYTDTLFKPDIVTPCVILGLVAMNVLLMMALLFASL